jgi:hypothetical protein
MPISAERQIDSFACERCGRMYLVVGNSGNVGTTENLDCSCGGAPRAQPLPVGVYEVLRLDHARAHEIRAEHESATATAVKTGESEETDLGYGKSHGYGPGHGGPTGPGDAPAGENDADVGPK